MWCAVGVQCRSASQFMLVLQCLLRLAALIVFGRWFATVRDQRLLCSLLRPVLQRAPWVQPRVLPCICASLDGVAISVGAAGCVVSTPPPHPCATLSLQPRRHARLLSLLLPPPLPPPLTLLDTTRSHVTHPPPSRAGSSRGTPVEGPADLTKTRSVAPWRNTFL